MRFHLLHSTTLALALALGVAACSASPIPLVAGARTPAAGGDVKTEVDDNGNTRIKVNVEHLAQPARIDPGARVYVVWVSQGRSAPKNVGSLILDNDLTGRLETVTPFRGFLLTITAESNPTTAIPRGTQVLSAIIPD
jgi:hypothetical protein